METIRDRISAILDMRIVQTKWKAEIDAWVKSGGFSTKVIMDCVVAFGERMEELEHAIKELDERTQKLQSNNVGANNTKDWFTGTEEVTPHENTNSTRPDTNPTVQSK